jgi:hypothetical protein
MARTYLKIDFNERPKSNEKNETDLFSANGVRSHLCNFEAGQLAQRARAVTLRKLKRMPMLIVKGTIRVSDVNAARPIMTRMIEASRVTPNRLEQNLCGSKSGPQLCRSTAEQPPLVLSS